MMFNRLLTVLQAIILTTLECEEENYGLVAMPVYDDIILNDSMLFHLTDVSLRIECAGKCGIDSRCKSFFFNKDAAVCQTHTVVFLDPKGAPSAGTRYYRKPTECYVGDTIGGGPRLFDEDGNSRANGPALVQSCATCYVIVDQVACLVRGNQVLMKTCKLPSTCSEVQLLDSSSSDGEYWLYPPSLGGKKVKIYCHGMASQTPSEFISLPNPNTGSYPALQNPSCIGESPAAFDNAGDTTYSKIRLDTTTMEVNRFDKSFATSTNVIKTYGEASDCYTNHGSGKAPCGPKGTFFINTAGTGLRFDLEINWIATGWMPFGEASRSADGVSIQLNCGGYCGHCYPDRPLILQPFDSQEPGESTATMFPCL